jgi:hypothetical protein
MLAAEHMVMPGPSVSDPYSTIRAVRVHHRTLLPLLLGPPCELAPAQPPLEVLFAGICSKSGTSSLVRSIMILVIGPGAANNVPITGPAHGRTTTDPVMYRLGGLPLCLW